MVRTANYYKDLSADYSNCGLVPNTLATQLINNADTYISLSQANLPEVTSDYGLVQIEQENKDWWPTHCEAQRQGRADILTLEYAIELVYLCVDGIFYGRTAVANREKHLWAITAQPGVTMTWPIVIFHGEVVYSEWNCFDNETNQTIAKGNFNLLRRGHRGGCYIKSEQLNFYRNVYTSNELLHWLRF